MDKLDNLNDFIRKFRENFFYTVCIIIVSAIILYIVVNVLFYNENVNEGNYRVSDAAVVNAVEIENVSAKDKWAYNVSSVDTLSILVSGLNSSKIKSVYVKNFYTDYPRKIILSQKNYESSISSNTEEILQLNVDSLEGNNVLYELQFKNINVLEEFIMPEDIDEVILDGTIYNLAGISIYDLTYTASFDLVIEEANGYKNIMQYEITMPNQAILSEGAYVSKLDTSQFVFKILNWKNFFRYL